MCHRDNTSRRPRTTPARAAVGPTVTGYGNGGDGRKSKLGVGLGGGPLPPGRGEIARNRYESQRFVGGAKTQGGGGQGLPSRTAGGGVSHDRAATATTAQAIPAQAREPTSSPKSRTASGTLTSGYNPARGVMTAAFPPLP